MASLVALRSQGASSWTGQAVYLRSRVPVARIPSYPQIRNLKTNHSRRFLTTAPQRPLASAIARRQWCALTSIRCGDALGTLQVESRIPYTDDDDSSSNTILACSSTLTLDANDERFLARLVRWLRRAAHKCWEALVISIRGTEVLLRLSPLLVMAPASVLAEPFLQHNNNIVADATWWYVTSAMQSLGPAFVKLCQWVATRRDLFPPNVCDRLAELHDRGNVHSWKFTDRILTDAFASYESKGLRVNRHKVIGCGSAAQVYEGSLSTTNAQTGATEILPVAVKVLHPRFEYMVERDLKFMQAVANMLHSLPSERVQMLNLPRAAFNFGSLLRRQADLREEGENLKQFRSNFYKNDKQEAKSAILFPRPIEDWMHANVLVEELVTDARPIADFIRDNSEKGTDIRRELAAPLVS